MLSWAVTFLVVAIIAGVLGLSGVAGTATNIAYVLFVLFVILALVGFLTGVANRLAADCKHAEALRRPRTEVVVVCHACPA